MADDTIEIEYELTKDEFVDFYKKAGMTEDDLQIPYTAFFKKIAGGTVRAFMLVLIVVFISRMLRNNGELKGAMLDMYLVIQMQAVWLIMAALFVFYFLLAVVTYRSKYKARFLKKTEEIAESFIEERKSLDESSIKLRLSEDGFDLNDGIMTRTASWKKVEQVEIFKNYFHIEMSGIEIFIPPRFFQSEEEKQRIFEQCQKWYLDAQGEKANA